MNMGDEARHQQIGTDHREAAVIMACHELRNALGPLLNAVELLNLPDIDHETERWARETLLRQAQQMKRLLVDMLDPQSAATGAFRLTAKILDLSQLVETVCTDHQGLFQAHGIQLIIDRSPTQVFVAADSVRLTQVVTNLLQNALKFTTRGGHVTVRVGADEHEGEGLISIRDTGIGMSPGVLAGVGAGQSEAKHLHGGKGIGLPLARNIIRQHGGELLANSGGPGQGSEFVVRFPLASTI